MKLNTPYQRILAVAFSVFTALGLANPAHAYSVYRGVHAHAGAGAVTWTLVSFGVGGHPPTLSFFHFPNDGAATAAANAPGHPGITGAQCLVRVDLPNTVAVPAPLAVDTVGILGLPVGANPLDLPTLFTWQIVFNNVPPDHWEIARAQITGAAANNPASRVAAAGFHTLANTAGSGVTVINGTLANCHV
jgi:hypothetical protein